MSSTDKAPGPFSPEALERLNALLLRQEFEFDQGHAPLLEHVGDITTEAARNRALGAHTLDILATTNAHIRRMYGSLGVEGLTVLLSAFALAMADELQTCGRHGAAGTNERTNR